MDKNFPETGYLRLRDILGQCPVTEEQAVQNRKTGKGPKRPRPGIQPIIPVSPATWWAGVKTGRFPRSIKLPGGNITVWRAEDIRAFLVSNGMVANDE